MILHGPQADAEVMSDHLIRETLRETVGDQLLRRREGDHGSTVAGGLEWGTPSLTATDRADGSMMAMSLYAILPVMYPGWCGRKLKAVMIRHRLSQSFWF